MKAKPTYRWLPMPYHSILLFVTWLLLNNTIDNDHLVLGAFLAIVIPLLTAGLSKPQPAMHKPWLTIRHCFLVLGDIITANIEVAIQVMGPLGNINPAMVCVPLDLNAELPITLLASTVSLTPGTVSAEVSNCRGYLYVHVLNLKDEQELINTIKQRYEAPLKEIFEC
ncbi:Na+/H+ antiporter subunit E [Nitrincola sp. MINF-07-Sa-05]|uniref:Na+/H+ antiporter subunit E n=1 Tax=Nitrincola salilacus TaxID=3400273 RepID=UPI0039182BB2